MRQFQMALVEQIGELSVSCDVQVDAHKTASFACSIGPKAKHLIRVSVYPTSGIAPNPHPRAEICGFLKAAAGRPTELQLPENAFGVRHHGGESTVWRGHSSQTTCAAIGVEGVRIRGLTMVVDKTHRAQHLMRVSPVCEICIAFTVSDSNG